MPGTPVVTPEEKVRRALSGCVTMRARQATILPAPALAPPVRPASATGTTGDFMETFTHCGRCGSQAPAGAHFFPGCGLDLRDGRARQPTGLLPPHRNLFARYVVIRLLRQRARSALYL